MLTTTQFPSENICNRNAPRPAQTLFALRKPPDAGAAARRDAGAHSADGAVVCLFCCAAGNPGIGGARRSRRVCQAAAADDAALRRCRPTSLLPRGAPTAALPVARCPVRVTPAVTFFSDSPAPAPQASAPCASVQRS
jgi:hypothetical protein